MDRVRDLVAAGDVSVVLAQDRDRIAREPAYHYLLRREFEEHGTKMRALNDRGDDSPEGELTDGILDQLGKYERAKIAERSRRGKLRKAREGKVMAGHRVKYGFRLNAARDGLLVDEDKMSVVRRVFRMVGAEGETLSAVHRAFEREGVPTPGGGKRWDRSFLRLAILDNAYRPHTYDEVAALVAPEVAARLDPDRLYGLWTYNRLHTRARQVSEAAGDGGRRYRRQVRSTERPEEERVRVPVPYAGIPRELVDAARDAIKDNRKPSNAGRRFWQLSGGILRCAICGMAMQSESVRAHSGDRYHFYYSCRTRRKHGAAACAHGRSHRAADLEDAVWAVVAGLLTDPRQLREGLDEMIEAERAEWRGDPEEKERAWLDNLAAVDFKRARFQDMAAEGHITFRELGAKLGELEEARQTAERELTLVRVRREALASLERDRGAIMESYAGMVPETREDLAGEERH